MHLLIVEDCDTFEKSCERVADIAERVARAYFPAAECHARVIGDRAANASVVRLTRGVSATDFRRRQAHVDGSRRRRSVGD